MIEAQRSRNGVRALGPAERVAQAHLGKLATGDDGYIDPEELLKFGASVDDFDEALESHALGDGLVPGEAVQGRGPLGGPRRDRDRPCLRGVLRCGQPAQRRSHADRGRARHRRRGGSRHVALDGCRDDTRGDDPGDARRLSADAPEDDGPVALDGPGRRQGRARLARDARPGGRLGHGARAREGDRGRPRAERRRRQGRPRVRGLRLRPGLVRDGRLRRVGRRWTAAAASSRARPSRTSAA